MDEKPTGTYFVGIRFPTSEKSYYFSTTETDLKIGDLVVIDTPSGLEMATVSTPVLDQAFYKNNLKLKPLLRKADDVDITNHEINLRNAKRALEIAQREIERLGLAMDLVSASYTLDGSKITICYTSTEKRVDFRELLRVLAPQLGARLELFQMAARDKAKYVGGIGICGLPLCCSTFLTTFDSISIHMAKNQMLAINNAKLSGHCGKYLCCLSYEDDLYTEEKRKFPAFGTTIHTPDGDYLVDGINILSETVRLCKADRSDYKTYPLEDIKTMQKGTYQKRADLDSKRKEEDDLPTFDFSPKANQGRDASYGGMTPSNRDKGNYSHVASDDDQDNRQNNRNRHRNRHGHRGKDDRNQQNQNQQNQQQKSQKQRQNRPENYQNNQKQPEQSGQKANNGRRNHHHHHRHHGKGQGGNNQGGNNQ